MLLRIFYENYFSGEGNYLTSLDIGSIVCVFIPSILHKKPVYKPRISSPFLKEVFITVIHSQVHENEFLKTIYHNLKEFSQKFQKEFHNPLSPTPTRFLKAFEWKHRLRNKTIIVCAPGKSSRDWSKVSTWQGKTGPSQWNQKQASVLIGNWWLCVVLCVQQ